MIKEAKDAKFATLLKEVTSKRSTTYCDASLGKGTVVTIPEDLPLNSAEHSVLSNGLTFVPTVNKTDEYQVKANSEKFFRRLRLKVHFHDSEDEHHEGDNHHDPFTKFDNKTSTWTPPDGKFSALDHYIDRFRRSIASRNYTKRPNFANLTQEERTALQDLRRRNDIISKPADKGGAVVVWKRDLYIQEAIRQLSDNRFYQRLDADPIQQDQKIVKNTIKYMIASCELPPTAKHLVVTTPRTSRFYMLPKIHKPNNPGRPIVSACCCPTENISAYLDEVMAPFVKQLPTYVKDTNHALSIFNSFTFDESDQSPCFLFTMDVKSLYTVIPNDGGSWLLFCSYTKNFCVITKGQLFHVTIIQDGSARELWKQK